VVRQDLAREHGLAVSLRTIQRAVAPYRRELAAEARATVRFETPPGHQLQVDFGELRTPVAGESGRVFLFVATLGYSRRPYVRAFRHERQSAWLDGIEGVFRHCGGVPVEVLLDNAKPLVTHHARRRGDAGGEVQRTGRWPSRATGASGRGPARHAGREPRARTNAALLMSSATRSPGIGSTAGRRWRRIWSAGRAR
jgi:transposase